MTLPTSAFSRAESLERLGGDDFDVVVIGGGVTGAGVALEAASRGLRVALVEKNDFASGTSSKSSKMIHGGLRYLQQREFRLVYENLAERQRLLENAPHLVAPLPFLIPLFGRDGLVSKAVERTYSTALWLYDVTGGIRIGKRHRKISRTEALEHLPKLRTDRLVAGFLYYDARADDARLTLTILRTAVLEFGATVANYTAVTEIVRTDGRVSAVRATATDPATGHGREVVITTRSVVNATGVWSDDVRELAEGTHPHSIQPAKGVHVTVAGDRLPADIAAVIPVPKDRRSIFVVPWDVGNLTYIGTTDTTYEGSVDQPLCTQEDVDYLLEAVNLSTSAQLTRADVTGVWAGLRPLLAPEGKELSERTADLSRRHRVIVEGQGVVTITGGKLTTYRKMAEDTIDALARHDRDLHIKRSRTASLRLRGAPKVAGDIPAGIPPHLFARYGTDAVEVLAGADGRSDLLGAVVDGLPYIGAEFLYAARSEMAVTLDDIVDRRTRSSIQRAQATLGALRTVAELVAPELGWDATTIEAQIEATTNRINHELAVAGVTEADASR